MQYIERVSGCLVVLAQWQSTGGSSQGVLVLSLSSIYASKRLCILFVVARDQEATIAALKASNCELLAQNESLQNVNSGLKDHMSGHSEVGSNGSSPPGITRLRAQLDVDLSGFSVRSNGSGNYATATATVPLKFDSQYRSTMERGV